MDQPQLVANAFVTMATNKDSKKASGKRKKWGGDEEKSEGKAVNKCDTIHAVKLAIGLRIAHMVTRLRSWFLNSKSRNCQSLICSTRHESQYSCINLRPINENAGIRLFIEQIVRGEEIRVTHVGERGPFKVVLYCSNAETNVLSSFEVAKTFFIVWDQAEDSVTGTRVPYLHSQDVLDMEYARRRAFNT